MKCNEYLSFKIAIDEGSVRTYRQQPRRSITWSHLDFHAIPDSPLLMIAFYNTKNISESNHLLDF